MPNPAWTSSTGASVSETLIVSPIPSLKRVPSLINSGIGAKAKTEQCFISLFIMRGATLVSNPEHKLLTSKGKLSNKIYNEKDKNLRMKILEVSNALNTSIKELKPHYIANYLYELSVAANDFYETNHLNKLTGEEKEDYLYILNLNNRIIKILLNILGIYIPTKM